MPDNYIDLIYCDILYNTGKKFKDYDDPDNYYCSEICYDACLYAGYKIALTDNPSPGDIEIYAAFNNWKNLYDL